MKKKKKKKKKKIDLKEYVLSFISMHIGWNKGSSYFLL